MWWCEWNQRNSWIFGGARRFSHKHALLQSCHAWILAPGNSQRPNKMKKNTVKFLHVMNTPLFDIYFQIHNQVRRPTIWAQPELPHEQVIRAHCYPKIPVNSRTSSCFSVSQRLSRWELDAICHLFELRTLGVYLWGADDLNMLDWQIDHVEISLDLAFQSDVKGMRWKA